MSYCREDGEGGKDRIIFVSEDDHKAPSRAVFDNPDIEDEPGLILPNGDINWNCPCLGGMATGPCGVEFREAFSCFHYSKEEPKGADCYDSFKAMQDCMVKYPALYDYESSNQDADSEEAGESMNQEDVSSTEDSDSNNQDEPKTESTAS